MQTTRNKESRYHKLHGVLTDGTRVTMRVVVAGDGIGTDWDHDRDSSLIGSLHVGFSGHTAVSVAQVRRGRPSERCEACDGVLPGAQLLAGATNQH